jgi:hypothetical protein
VQRAIDWSKYSKRHIALKVAYIGWNYHGLAVQQDTEETVEGHLIRALLKTHMIEDIKSANFNRSGRTDKGVSAFGQVEKIVPVLSKLLFYLPFCSDLISLITPGHLPAHTQQIEIGTRCSRRRSQHEGCV